MRPIFLRKLHSSASLFAIALAVYLLFFSSFALFHAYSENELVDSHGCAVGAWVQQCQASLPFLTALALFLIPLSVNPLPRRFLPVAQRSRQKATRAPPYHASLS